MHVSRRLLIIALCGLAGISLPVSTAQAASARMPSGGWLAGFTASNVLVQATDPINLVLHDPHGTASNTFESALQARGGWGYNTCLNWAVTLKTDSPGSWNSPITSYATDTGYNGNDWWLPGNTCGNSTRDHLRLWHTANNQWAYVAASYEYNGCTVHCVASNGFDNGRNRLYSDIYNGLRAIGRTFNASSPVAYNPGYFTGIRYSGQIAYFDIH